MSYLQKFNMQKQEMIYTRVSNVLLLGSSSEINFIGSKVKWSVFVKFTYYTDGWPPAVVKVGGPQQINLTKTLVPFGLPLSIVWTSTPYFMNRPFTPILGWSTIDGIESGRSSARHFDHNVSTIWIASVNSLDEPAQFHIRTIHRNFFGNWKKVVGLPK